MSWYKSKRLGRFEIDADIIDEMPEVVRKVMGTVIVIHADAHMHRKVIVYFGLSDHFDELEDNAEPPLYDMGYDEDTGEVQWQRSEGA